ncbi:MAG: VCBS repeat-containing protein [Nitrospirae bacterium]|nr:VCBS repeat-containing protein [Nitrospirota bacterium]
MLENILKKTRDVDRKSSLFALLLLVLAAAIAVSSVAEAALSVTNAPSISTQSYGNPVRIAKDKAGLIYVTIPRSGKVLIYSQNGALYNLIESSFSKPLSIAIDNQNRIYVGDEADGSVTVIDSTGKFLFKLGVGNGEFGLPNDIAISSSGNAYVVDSKNNTVKMYSKEGQYLGVFGGIGSAEGKFNFPTGIAIDDTKGEVDGSVYVVDFNNARVQMFDLSGSFKKSFGSFGDAVGQFARPQGIAVAEGYVFVTDAYNAKVQVYDTAGNYQNNDIGSFGTAVGNLKVPMDIVKIGTKIYVTNSDNARIEVFEVKDPNGLTITPASVVLDYVIGKDFAISSNANVEAQGTTALSWTARSDVDWLTFPASGDTTQSGVQVSLNQNITNLAEGVYTGRVMFQAQNGSDYVLTVTANVKQKYDLSVSPAALSIAYNQNLASTAKTLNISAGNGKLTWTAVSSVNWLDVAASGTTPVAIQAVLNNNADYLAAGVHSAFVTINAPDASNSSVTIPVTLTVKKIAVSSESISVTHKKGSALETVSVAISGGVNWVASKDASNWFSIAQTASGVVMSLNQSVEQMGGVSNGSITITVADGSAANSPLVVPVSVSSISAGKIVVSSNIDQSVFSISGPATLSGAGKAWVKDEAVPGIYTITFNNIRGYRKPATKTFEVFSGNTVTLNGSYKQNAVANVVAVTQGPGSRNDANVRLLDLNGNLINEFRAFSSKYGAKVAMGDVDGDGSSEIVVGSGAGSDIDAAVKVFKYNGSLMASIGAIANTSYGANVAVGDIDGDGTSEIAVSTLDDVLKTNKVSIYSYDISNRLVEKGSVTIADGSKYPANIAFGDVNNDGRLELIVVGSKNISTYTVNGSVVELYNTVALTVSSGLDYAAQMTISAGDVNGDGMDEILLGYVDNNDSVVGVYSGNMSSFMYAVNVFANGKSAPSISCMDWSGEGIMEIIAGQGAASDGRSAARIFGSDGSLVKEINAFRASKYGVNAAFGVIK